MKVARIRKQPQPRLTSPFGIGGTTPQPALDDLSDVDTTGVSDGDTIVFDDATDTWIPGTGGSGGSSIYLNVKDPPYNAVGDDTADDTTAIQDAIDDLEASGGTIYFPTGTYKITAELVVSPGSLGAAIRILGEGATGEGPSSVIRQHTSNTNGIRAATNEYDLLVEHIKILGPTGGSSGAGLYGNNRNISTRNVRIEGFYYGLRLGGSSFYAKHDGSLFYNAAAALVYMETGANNATFVGCHLTTAPIGFDIRGAESVVIVGGSVENTSTVGIELDTNGGQTTDGTYIGGVYFENSGINIRLGNSNPVRGTVIEGCFFVSGTWNIDAKNTSYLTIASCDFYSSPSTGDIRLQSGAANAVLINNRPSGAGNTFTAAPVIVDGTSVTPSADGSNAAGSSTYFARADHTHALGGSAGGDLSGTYPNPSVVDDSHSHTAATAPGGGGGELVISSTHSTPLVFADLVQTSAGDDLIYTSS